MKIQLHDIRYSPSQATRAKNVLSINYLHVPTWSICWTTHLLWNIPTTILWQVSEKDLFVEHRLWATHLHKLDDKNESIENPSHNRQSNCGYVHWLIWAGEPMSQKFHLWWVQISPSHNLTLAEPTTSRKSRFHRKLVQPATLKRGKDYKLDSHTTVVGNHLFNCHSAPALALVLVHDLFVYPYVMTFWDLMISKVGVQNSKFDPCETPQFTD